MYSIQPKWEIIVYGFRNTNNELNGGNSPVSDYFSDDRAFRLPQNLPMEYVSDFYYTDTTEGGDFEVNISKGIYASFKTGNGYTVYLDELLSEGHIVVFKENDYIRFSGYIVKRSRTDESNGESVLKITGDGLEGIVERQLLTIDISPEFRPDKKLKDATVINSSLSNYQKGIQKGFNDMTGAISSMGSPSKVISTLFKKVLENYLNWSLFGGYKIADDLIDSDTGMTEDTYSNSMIHTIPWLNQPQFGSQINYWNLMESLVTQPLYEMFFHYNEESQLYVSEDQYIPTNFSEFNNIGVLVFRKTPWDLLDVYNDINPAKIPNETLINNKYLYLLNENRITSMNLDSDLNDIFSGIQVRLTSFEPKKSSQLVPPLYNPALLAKFGQRVLTVNLDGIEFQNKNKTKIEQQSNNLVKELKEKLYATFGQGTKIVSGNINIDYDRKINKGVILKIYRTSDSPSSKLLDRYMDSFYVSGIRVSCNPSRGEASMSLSVKWGEVRTRKKDELFPVETIAQNSVILANL